MSQDPKKKSKSRRVKPLDEKGGETPSKGAVPLNEGPKKEAAYSLDSSENVDPNAGFLNEETSPDAQALTMESVSLKTDLDHMSEPPPSSALVAWLLVAGRRFLAPHPAEAQGAA